MENEFAIAKQHTASSLWFIVSKSDGTSIIQSAMSFTWCKRKMDEIQSDFSRMVKARGF